MFKIKKSRHNILWLIAGILILPLLLGRTIHATSAVGLNDIYLPLVLRNFPPPPTVFGGQVYEFTDPDLVQLAVDAKVSLLRIPAFDWNKNEPNAPVGGVHTYDWSSVPKDSLLNMANNHIYAIATVQFTPSWAQKFGGVYCGPVAQEHFSDFAAFLQEAVRIYGSPPYNIHYWELGNEPDVDPDLVSPVSGFGCWGDNSDSYYGGGYYAEMLKVIYPAIKAVDPQAQVLIGGLLLDCDPDDSDCTNTKPPRFLEGILRNGGGNFFDIVSYHGYPYYQNGLPVDENFPTWDQRGGVMLGKANFLREVMASFGVSKPLLHTEGALICPEWNTLECKPPDQNYEDAKADYVIWLYARALANDIDGSIWYTFDTNGWRNGSLIGDTSNPNPAYFVFKFMTTELAGAQYIGQPLGAGASLRNFAFQASGKTVWVVWSPDNQAHTLALPSGYTQVLDKLGDPIAVSGSTLEVKSPIYVELP